MLGLLMLVAAAAAAPDPAGCSLSLEDKVANAKLGFDAFDQTGSASATGRKLTERGCWQAAAEAWADYLIRGPVPSPNEQRILLWHMGQALAFSGQETMAAKVIGATRRPDPAPPETGPLDWNDYVRGTWAFLVKDRPTLRAMRDAVLASPGPSNRINGNLLAAMERCFEKPYALAYDPKCGR